MTNRRDYQRDILEVMNQRSDMKSKYNGVSRIHCKNGYVDIRATATTLYPEVIIARSEHVRACDVNGLSIDKSVDEFLSWAKVQKISISDVFYYR